jgi:hypothetical protein
VTKKVGWEAYEDIVVGLVNITQCGSCQALINYNGLPPEKCPRCHGLMKPDELPGGEIRR